MRGDQTFNGLELLSLYVLYYVTLVQNYEFEMKRNKTLDLLLYYVVVCY